VRSRYARPADGAPAPPKPPRDRGGDASVLADLRAGTSRPILVSGGTVLSQDRAVGDLDRGDLLIRGRTIAAVGPDLREQAADAIVVDASDAIVLPGFVDCHVHAWEGQLRGCAPVIDFDGYLRLTAFGYGPLYTPHDNYVGTLRTALTALDAGYTTIIDNSNNSRTPDHSSAAVEALIDAGIRGVHASGIPVDTEVPTWPGDVERLRSEYFGSEDQLVTLRLFDPAPAEHVWQFAKDHDLWMSHETAAYYDALLPGLAAKGLLTDRHTFNHCIDLADRTWSLITSSGATVNICPRSEPTFGPGGGYPPTEKMREFGVRPGLSGDNEISYALNPFAEMQTLLTTDRARIIRRTHDGEHDVPDHLGAEDLLEFATLRGAVNAALADRTGSLTPGKEADVVLVRTTDLNTAPLNNALATVTTFAHPGNVDTVFVAGRPRKFRGELVGHDLDALRGLVEASRDRLVAAQRQTKPPSTNSVWPVT
jgi:5-methylthioadenosine/S-adenosylhomocysteine deaminase